MKLIRSAVVGLMFLVPVFGQSPDNREVDAERERQLLLLLEQFLEDRQPEEASRAVANPSLYSPNSPNLFLFTDHKARRLDDIVTIQIVESATATNSANTSTSRDGSTSVAAPSLFGLESGGSPLNFASLLNAMSNLSFDGEGTTSRAGSLVASLSARVIEVRPNGDLVLEGMKEVRVNNETHVLTLRGVARTQDIGPTNVISSSHIANMQVTFDGDGVVSKANKPGLFYRLVQFISPF